MMQCSRITSIIEIKLPSVVGGRQNSLNASLTIVLSSRSSFGLSKRGNKVGNTLFSNIWRRDEKIPARTLSANKG